MTPPPVVDTGSAGPGALPWIIGGVGVLSLGAAGYFALQRNSADDDLNKVCNPQGVCPQSSQSLQDDGERYALMTNIAAGVGVVAIGVAVVLLVTGSKSSPTAEETAKKRGFQNVRVGVSTGPTTGVNVIGQF